MKRGFFYFGMILLLLVSCDENKSSRRESDDLILETIDDNEANLISNDLSLTDTNAGDFYGAGETLINLRNYDKLADIIIDAEEGDVIRFESGTYFYKYSVMLKGISNLTLTADEGVYLILEDAYAPVFDMTNCQNISIKGFYVSHENQYACTGDVVRIADCTGITVINGFWAGCGQNGTTVWQSENIVLSNNVYYRNWGAGVLILENVENITISDNTFENNGYGVLYCPQTGLQDIYDEKTENISGDIQTDDLTVNGNMFSLSETVDLPAELEMTREQWASQILVPYFTADTDPQNIGGLPFHQYENPLNNPVADYLSNYIGVIDTPEVRYDEYDDINFTSIGFDNGIEYYEEIGLFYENYTIEIPGLTVEQAFNWLKMLNIPDLKPFPGIPVESFDFYGVVSEYYGECLIRVTVENENGVLNELSVESDMCEWGLTLDIMQNPDESVSVSLSQWYMP